MYRLDVRATPYRPSSGQTASLEVHLKTAAGKNADDALKDGTLRLYIVREDVGEVYLEEPTHEQDGSFSDSFAFPSGGEWRIFGETVPEDGDPQITDPVKLSVDGVRPVRAPLVPQMLPMSRVNGYTLTLKQPTRIDAGTSQTLVFSLFDSQGQPVEDMPLWREAIAHLVLVDRAGKTLIHAIPDPNDPRTGRTEYLVFPVTFPDAGAWRGWVLFQRGGQVTTIPIALRVTKP